jgi:Uma2 family endonuclease
LVTAGFLVVEVISESTATADYREKVAEYQAIGIPEYWILTRLRRPSMSVFPNALRLVFTDR